MTFDPTIITDNATLFFRGALTTMLIGACSILAGFMLSIPMALMALSHRLFLRTIASAYVEWFRNIPFIVVLYLFFYGLPFFGARLPEYLVGIIALACFSGTYFTEIIRGSVLAVPQGQIESARAVGMSYFRGLWEVVAPQTLRFLIPPSTNTSISMIKETSILSTITITELTYEGLVVQGQTFAPFEVFFTTAAIYWMITAAFAALMRRLEQVFSDTQGGQQTRTGVADRYLRLDARRVS